MFRGFYHPVGYYSFINDCLSHYVPHSWLRTAFYGFIKALHILKHAHAQYFTLIALHFDVQGIMMSQKSHTLVNRVSPMHI